MLTAPSTKLSRTTRTWLICGKVFETVPARAQSAQDNPARISIAAIVR
jgi:hypothetical protein